MARSTKVQEQAMWDVYDLYRRYPNSEMRFNYEDSTARLYTHGVDEKVLIFGDSFQTFAQLANKAQKCMVSKLLERMKATVK